MRVLCHTLYNKTENKCSPDICELLYPMYQKPGGCGNLIYSLWVRSLGETMWACGLALKWGRGLRAGLGL